MQTDGTHNAVETTAWRNEKIPSGVLKKHAKAVSLIQNFLKTVVGGNESGSLRSYYDEKWVKLNGKEMEDSLFFVTILLALCTLLLSTEWSTAVDSRLVSLRELKRGWIIRSTHWQPSATLELATSEIFSDFRYPTGEPELGLGSLFIEVKHDFHELDQPLSEHIKSVYENKGRKQWSGILASTDCKRNITELPPRSE